MLPQVVEFGIALGGSAIGLACTWSRHFGPRFHGFRCLRDDLVRRRVGDRLHFGGCLPDATPRAVPGTPLGTFATTLGGRDD